MLSIPILFSKSTTKAWNKPMFTKIYTHLFQIFFCLFMWHFYLKTCSFSQKAAAKYRYPHHCPGLVLKYSSFCRVGGSRKVQFCFVLFFSFLVMSALVEKRCCKHSSPVTPKQKEMSE